MVGPIIMDLWCGFFIDLPIDEICHVYFQERILKRYFS